MKKKLSYRDKLLELAYIYNVKEIQEYVKRKKNLTTGQIELILKKNKIIIPKDFKSSFFRENFSKPISKLNDLNFFIFALNLFILFLSRKNSKSLRLLSWSFLIFLGYFLP